MNIGNKRKQKLVEFTLKEYGINGLLLAALFLYGAFLSWNMSIISFLMYLLLWVGSFFVIHAITCRNCVYYGKKCPVPFEGSCADRFFSRGSNFGIFSGFGALITYFLRVCIPYAVIIKSGSVLHFILYSALFALFFYVLLYHTGCPNCINTKCPFNPDFST